MDLLVTVEVADAQGNKTVRTDLYPVADPSAFPQEYSLSRPLLVNNPGVLVTGEDWQDMNRTQDVLDLGFFRHTSGADPANTGYVTLNADPAFVKVIRCKQGDGRDFDHPLTTSSTRTFPKNDKAWYRFTIKYQAGFTTDGPRSGAKAWKMVFGGKRHIVFKNTRGRYRDDAASDHYPNYGGSVGLLPNSEASMGFANNGGPGEREWTDEEWWEYIIYEERVSSTHYRTRYWRRELTANGMIRGPASSATWINRFGRQSTGATVPTGDQGGKIQMGVNRNSPMFAGQEQWFEWGPWEVLDGAIVADPYGIASQII